LNFKQAKMKVISNWVNLVSSDTHKSYILGRECCKQKRFLISYYEGQQLESYNYVFFGNQLSIYLNSLSVGRQMRTYKQSSAKSAVFKAFSNFKRSTALNSDKYAAYSIDFYLPFRSSRLHV